MTLYHKNLFRQIRFQFKFSDSEDKYTIIIFVNIRTEIHELRSFDQQTNQLTYWKSYLVK